ncbi:MAG: histidine kinase [Bacteroidota bacterium]
MKRQASYILPIIIFLGLSALAFLLRGVGNSYLIAISWILSLISLLWWGNLLIARKLDELYPWSEFVSKRFFLQISISTLYSVVCTNLSYYVFKTFLIGLPPDPHQFLLLNVYGLLFSVPVACLIFGVYFFMQWKKTYVYTEELKGASLRSEFESLKSHLDPHFLFNSLNILYALIERDQQAALTYLEHFTDVYRYVLRHKQTSLVPLKTELGFIESYGYMLEARFKDQLSVEIEVPGSAMNKQIPPLSIQQLMENAIKHNKASEKYPLTVRITYETGDRLRVVNNLQPFQTPPSSNGTGLENIRKRYEFLSDDVPSVEKNETHFSVNLPLIATGI